MDGDDKELGGGYFRCIVTGLIYDYEICFIDMHVLEYLFD